MRDSYGAIARYRPPDDRLRIGPLRGSENSVAALDGLLRLRFGPSMRQRINLTGIYVGALRGLADTIDDQPPLPVPDVCPVTLDELLAGTS